MNTKAETNRTNLMALLAALSDRAKLDETIASLTRALATAHGIPATYPLPE